ncbi:phosphopantetheine-binding protein [Desulfogranum japonicum]|uniref:phosphopantetheine-binding protein n=1 Tax=Desulfogranum japonicum TaxID=231447 RepID=UPI00042155CE|nr:phosphopantetheine-binding protein [Desulfogranum japonicum]
MESFEQELLELICTTCNLEMPEIQYFNTHAPLIGPESVLGIDSIDALEIAVTVQQTYGVRMDNENSSRDVLQSLATLSSYIQKNI